MNPLLTLSLVVLAVASASYTVSSTWIFESLRSWVSYWSNYLGRGIGCGYCLSHWLAAPATAWLTIYGGIQVPPVQAILLWLAISWLSGVLWLAVSILAQLKDRKEFS